MAFVTPNRRMLLAVLGSLPFLGKAAWADEVIDLEWEDLLPEGAPIPKQNWFLDNIHDSLDNFLGRQPASSGVRGDYNGKIVRIPGYIIPIDMDGTGVTSFILAPFIGACVHVPPPPANQLIFVTTQEPYETKGLFEAVNVTGMFGVSSISTQLADIGYALSADEIEPFS